MEVYKSGDGVRIEMTLSEALLFAARIGEVMGISEDEMNAIFEEVME